MSYSAFLVVLAQALLTQSAVGQCINRFNAPGLLAPGFGAALLPAPACSGYNLGAGIAAAPYVSAIDITPTTGGGLPVTSGSPIPVNSISVASENVYEGTLSVGGELPFVGTVSFDGVTPSAGSGAVNHACGNGVTAMASNGIGYNAGSGLATVSPVSIASAPIASITPASALAPSATIPRLASLAPSAAFPQLAPRASSILAPGNAILSSPINSARALSPAAPLGIRGGLGAIAEYPGYAPYGGAGEGNVAVAGELPVVGNTAVIGQVPIMGAVSFNGAAPAAGAVSIAGKCACEDVLVYV